jgi:hypothetical protein
MMNFIIHPDYVTEDREMRVFKALLSHLDELRAKAGLWIPLPCELNDWWRQRSRMKLIKNGNGWEIEGDGKERARLAFATLENGELVYDLESLASSPGKVGADKSTMPVRDRGRILSQVTIV